MKIKIIAEPLPGVLLLEAQHSEDIRGDFMKYYNQEEFRNLGIDFEPAESFISRSRKNVIRGIHYQAGRSSHKKLVCCLKGNVIDVVVDIRQESPNFNKPVTFALSERNKRMVIIDKGYGHGFLSLGQENWMIYATTTVYDKERDCGILWSSIDYDWPVTDPIVSERDEQHPNIKSLIEKK